MSESRPVTVKPEIGTAESSVEENSNSKRPPKFVVLADLNVDPPEADEDDSIHVSAPDHTRLANGESSQDKCTVMCNDSEAMEGEVKRSNKLGKCRSRNNKADCSLDYGGDADGDQHVQGVPSSREEKVSSLKTGLVHVARKMPKNAHAHFILGLMYQRLGQPQKAVLEYEKATEILLRPEAEIDRPDLLSLVQIHHAQCLIVESSVDSNSDKEIEPKELEEILSKLKESMQSDIRQAALWNSLGLILLKSGRLQWKLGSIRKMFSSRPSGRLAAGV